ncbi:MAG: ATP-binding protein [Bacteroidota bacterium]
MRFYNRQDELTRLEDIWSNTGGQVSFGVIYGRRRVGKSTLLKRKIGSSDIYHLAAEGNENLQLKLFSQSVAKVVPAFDKAIYPDWHTALELLNTRVDKSFTLVLDEFPYLAKSSKSLPSILQAWVDRKEKRKFNLVLCGSSQQMMNGLVLSGNSPLYGRADTIMKLRPLEAGYLKDHLPEESPESLIEEFAVWGGIPRYWELRSQFDKLEDAIKGLLLSPDGTLIDEPKRLLLDDIRDLDLPISLLTFIALGSNRASEIGGRLERKATELYRPLNKLIDLGYVRRELPYGTSPRDRKHVLYKINDPFLQFFYSMVFPNMSAIEQGGKDDIWAGSKTQFDQIVSSNWEELCRRAIIRGAIGKGLWKASRWWGQGTDRKKYELDIVVENKENNTLLVGECKWSDLKDDTYLRDKLFKKALLLPFYKNQKIELLIAARSFSEEPSGLFLTPEMVLDTLR